MRDRRVRMWVVFVLLFVTDMILLLMIADTLFTVLGSLFLFGWLVIICLSELDEGGKTSVTEVRTGDTGERKTVQETDT